MAFTLSIDPSSGSLAGYSPIIGEVPNPGPTAIYTVPAGKNTLIASIEILNASGGAANVSMALDVGGGPFNFTNITGMASNVRNVNAQPRNLPEGTQLLGSSDVAGVTYIIQIQEYTP